MEEITGVLTIPPAMILSAFGMLITAVVYFHKQTARKLDQCEDNHGETSTRLFDLNGRMERLEGTLEGRDAGVQVVVDAVIKEVQSIREG